ncbi:MAG: hypothetical protein IH872_05545 [Chloroflexi bacterium]|nr:hypothetical protein [Chloroflexota bacterium]
MPQSPDSHDLDKLNRWHEGLNSNPSEGFPVCALFLTSGEDRRAHDIFRIYRAAFEELGAGFHDLVIFGQHGLSSTRAALITGWGLSSTQMPSLVLIAVGENGLVLNTTGLPAGALAEGETEEDGGKIPWRIALEAIKRSVEQGSQLSLDRMKGFERTDLPDGTLADMVGIVKIQVEAAGT